MPAIAVIVASYRFDEPEGIPLLIDRDSEDENLADVMASTRSQLDEGYAAFVGSDGPMMAPSNCLIVSYEWLADFDLPHFDTSRAMNIVGGTCRCQRVTIA